MSCQTYHLRMRRLFALLFCLWGGAATAHPHIFIDARVGLIFDDAGQLTAIRVAWVYDEFYSLVQLEELDLDPDGDGELTEPERAKLAGFDTDWIEGYEGDIYVKAGGQLVKLSGPTEPGAQMLGTQIETWHIRTLETPIDPIAKPVEVKVYDPGFYTAYSVDADVALTGRAGCSVEVLPADLNKAYDLVEELLYGPGAENVQEDNFPEVGEHFADTLTLKCVPGS